MSSLFVNTNRKNLSTDGREIFEEDIVATFADPSESDPDAIEQIETVSEDDEIFAYESGTGVVAVGTSLEDGVSDPSENLVVPPEEKREWHVDVDWETSDFDDPVSASDVRDLCGSPVYARGTIASLSEDCASRLRSELS